jgi:pimeloyl-ACP methyl ester carboxylesterase
MPFSRYSAFMQQKFVYGLNARGFHKIAYYVWGGRNATRTVVCVHGLTRNARDFDRLAASLAAEKMRVICIDVVGRGASDWLSDPSLYAYPQYLSDMAVVLARLAIKQVDWVGTSMGGLIGILLAAQPNSPIKRLILNDVGPFIPASSMERISTYINALPVMPDYASAAAYLRRIYHNTGPCTEADHQAMALHSIRPLPQGGFGLRYDPAIAHNFAAIKGDVDLWAVYDAIKCPTLLLRGAISDVLPEATARSMTERGPRAQCLTIPAIGHYPALMDSVQIEAIKKFLLS